MGKRLRPGVTTTETYDNGVHKKRTIENYDPKIYGINSTLTYQEVCKLFKIKRLPQISSFGRIKKNGRIMPGQRPNIQGYVSTNMYGFVRCSHIALMAVAGKTPSSTDKTTVEHTNIGYTNRSINHLDTLVLMSQREQIRSSYENNRSRNTSAAQRETPILFRKVGTEKWLYCHGISAFSREFNVNSSHVCKCLHGTRKTCGGYEFKKIIQHLHTGERKMPVLIDGKTSGAFITNMSRFIDTTGLLKTINPPSHGQRRSVKINGRQYQFSVLVYAAFNSVMIYSTTEGIGNGLQINHKDGNRINDDPDNLEKLDPYFHAQHSAKIPTKMSSGICKSIPLHGKKVCDMEWTKFSNSNDASRITGINQGSIIHSKDYINKDGTRRKCTGNDGMKWEFKSLDNDESQLPLDGELWFDVYPKHMAPNYFKRLAESIFTCEVCP